MRLTLNIRNLFDQYDQEENRLTHSLLHTIASDKEILKNFIKFSVGKLPFERRANILIGSQGKFTCQLIFEKSNRTKMESIPDGLIYDNEGKFCILIESKVTAPLDIKQLDAHLRQIKRYGVQNPILIILTTDRKSPEKVINSIKKHNAEVYWKPWWQIYQWIDRYKSHGVVKEFRAYMELLELNIINRNNVWEGMMTKFNGIPFGDGEPYSYSRAKWCLNSFLNELRKHRKLQKIYDIDSMKGRGQITGSAWSVVWDFIPFKGGEDSNFTKHPHLTFVIRPEWTQVQITLPNNAKAKYWNKLTKGGKDSLNQMLLKIHKNLINGKPRKPSTVKLWVEILQRHYPFQKDVGVKDGEMHFDVDCLSETMKIERKVKTFVAWLDALNAVLANRKKANFQIAIVSRYDHVPGSIVGKPEFIEESIRALGALKPFYEKISL